MYQLSRDANEKVLKEVRKIFVKNAVSLFKEIYSIGGTDSGLKKILGNSLFKKITKNEIKTHVNSILSSSSNKNSANKKISTAMTQYESLITAYKKLEAEINSSKSTTKTIQASSTAFTNTAKKLQNSLKSLGVTISLDDLPKYYVGLTYGKNDTTVTVPAGYTSELKTSDYKSSVKMIYAGDFTEAVTINGNDNDNTIYCGTGSDQLYGRAGKDILYGGVGNDTLYGGADNDALFGEFGSDKLFGEAGDDTLNGGAGSDTLTGGAGKDVFYYSSGDGADIITDYTAGDDKIKIASGKIDKVTMSGKTVIFKIGSGSIKVQNAKDKEIVVVDSSNNTSKYRNGQLVSGGSGGSNAVTVTLSADTTDTFDLTTYNETAAKKAVNIDASASENYLTIYGDDRANTIVASNGGGYVYAGKGNDVIRCGNGDDDIHYLEGGGNDTVYNFKTNDDIYLWGGVQFKNATLKGNDVILNLASGNTITLKNAKNERIHISGYDTNGNSVGTNTFGKGTISGKTISLLASYEGTFRLSDYSANPLNVNASASKSGLTIYGDDRANTIWAPNNTSYWGGDIYAGKGNDVIYCGNGYDRIYYYKGDGNETVYNFKTGDDIYLDGGSYYGSNLRLKNVTLKGNDVILNLNSGNTITLKNAKNERIYISGYDTNGNSVGTNTFGKGTISGKTISLLASYEGTFRLSDYSANPLNVNASASKSGLTIYGDDRANTIWASNGGGYVYAGKGNDVIHCGSGNTDVDAGEGNDVIHCGSDGGYIYAGKGNDTIYCGNGYDYIYYYKGDGNETVHKFKTGDGIYLDGGSSYGNVRLKNVTLNGNDVILNLDSGSKITLKNAKNEQIYIGGYDIDGNSVGTNTFGKVKFSGKTMSLLAGYEGTFRISDYSLNPLNVNASASENNLTIYGDDRANTIVASNGGGDIYAGKGNDVIRCGNGDDDIHYLEGGGNDTVYNFKTNDDIYLWSGVQFKNATLKGNDVILNLASGNTITLKNAKNEQICVHGYDTNSNWVGEITFSSSLSKNVTYSSNTSKDYWFMDTKESSNVDELDSLMREMSAANNNVGDLDLLTSEIPTANNAAASSSMNCMNDPNNLLNSVTFAQVEFH